MDKYYKRIKNNLDLSRIKEIAHQIFQFEYPFCYRDFAGSAQLCFKELQRSGAAGAELITLPADGKTAYFDFIMPEAWDVEEASLDIIEPAGFPRKRIADLKESSFCVANRCAATPAEGVIAELIFWEEAQKKEDLTGKIVFTLDLPPGNIRDEVVARNGLGIISSFSAGMNDLPNGIYWLNGWKGGPGWYHTAQDKKIICFNISPRRGKELSRLLVKSRKVKVLAKVKSRTYDGNICSVTGLIPGASRKEILLMAHLYEPHLDDNAVGAAALIEICRVIKTAVDNGILPPLKRSIRFLMSQERYGFSQFFSEPGHRNRVVAAINVDSIASGPAITKEPVRIRYSPMNQPFSGDFLLEYLAGRYLPEKYPRRLEKGNFSDDTWAADRTIGIPTNWLWTPPGGYHHNSLNADALDWNLGLEMVVIIATYVYCLSADDSVVSSRIGEIALETAQRKSLDFYRRKTFGLMKNPVISNKEIRERCAVFNSYLDNSLETLRTIGVAASKVKRIREQAKKTNRREQKRLCGSLSKSDDITRVASRPDKKAANLVVKRILPGIPFSLVQVPAGERKKLPNGNLEIIINWLDGKRDLAEAFRFFEYEQEKRLSDPEKEALIDALLFLEKYGYFKICPKTVLTKSEIKRGLKAVGIRAGDRVVLHSSLAGLGYIKGGPAAVYRALMELITDKGVILMPSFNHGQVFAEGARGYFSPIESPTVDGAVPESFRHLPGVFRSLDPTHPFLAWGKAAREYVRNHHRLLTMGEDSPLHLLEKAGGKVILIDAPTANTFHHVVEMTDNAPCLGKRTEEYPVKLPGGRMVRGRTWGWRNGNCPITDSAQYLKLMKKRGLIREGKIGNAPVLLFMMADCRKVIEEFLTGKVKGFTGCRVCRIRPRVNKWTVVSDWDEKAKKVRPDTTAFTDDYPGVCNPQETSRRNLRK